MIWVLRSLIVNNGKPIITQKTGVLISGSTNAADTQLMMLIHKATSYNLSINICIVSKMLNIFLIISNCIGVVSVLLIYFLVAVAVV